MPSCTVQRRLLGGNRRSRAGPQEAVAKVHAIPPRQEAGRRPHLLPTACLWAQTLAEKARGVPIFSVCHGAFVALSPYLSSWPYTISEAVSVLQPYQQLRPLAFGEKHQEVNWNPRQSSKTNAAPLELSRRFAVGTSVAAGVAGLVGNPQIALAGRGNKFKSAGGLEYFDKVIGSGGETFDGDTIKITFTAHTYDIVTGEKIRTFDPFINGGGGSSMTKGFKLTLGGSNGDIIPGLNLGIVGGNGVEPMKQGGRRVLRIPPELAYGSEGHHCYLAMKDQCEVPPDTPVEIEVEFVGFV